MNVAKPVKKEPTEKEDLAPKKDLFTQLRERGKARYGEYSRKVIIPHWSPSGSTMLDFAIRTDGQGLPSGRLYEWYGKETAGKTLQALLAIRQAQLVGGLGIFLDVERALSPDQIELARINEDLNWIYEKPDTAEEALQTLGELLAVVRDERGERPVVLVVDSVAALVPKNVFETDYDKVPAMASLARLLSRFFPEGMQYISNLNCYLIFLNQVRVNMKTGGFGGADPETTPGGRALRHYASLRLKFTSLEKETDSDKRAIGKRVMVEVVKSKVSPSGRKIIHAVRNLVGEPVMGIDDELSIIDYLIGREVLKKPIDPKSGRSIEKSPFYVLGEVKATRTEMSEMMRGDPGFGSHVREVLGNAYRQEYGRS